MNRGAAGSSRGPKPGRKAKPEPAAPLVVPDGDGGAIVAALRALEADGRLTPESVVGAASNPESPLHYRFEWDNTKAAHAFRLEQARRLIRSVEVVFTVEDQRVRTVNYVRDPRVEDDEQGYVSLARLRSDPDSARAMVRMEFARAEACLRRAQDLAAVLGLGAAVAAAVKKVAGVRRQVERQAAAS